MKIIQIIILLFIALDTASAQREIFGKYKDYFGSIIELKRDSTFLYSWSFDLSYSWTNGYWKIFNDTIFFTTSLVYDTLSYFDEEKKTQIDILVLSKNKKTNKIDSNEYMSGLLSGEEQNCIKMPEKLYYKNNKLFGIDKNGKLLRKKVNGFGTKKKHYTWYIKIE